MTEIRLHNTKTRQKEVFTPIDPENVRIYLCGPTVYDRAHLGNARNVIMFDVLFRLLRHTYGAEHVTYVRNFTDVDDKINARAAETGRTIGEITAETTQWYLDDMAALGTLEPTAMPRATAYIPQMIEMIETLIARGHAYAAEGHVLFAVESYENYGKLSGRAVDDMIAGARVEVAPYKRNPMDFVLWKPSADDLPGWDSPWGRGRPGWHIECSAMSHALLGASFDIHGGGNDLMFPHHENEIAQSRCAHPEGDFARFWLHNEMLQVEGRKMSKSLGNFFTVRDLLDEGVPGEVIRFVFLSTHYGKPMDWTAKKAREAEKVLRQCAAALERWKADCEANSLRKTEPTAPSSELVKALSDDLNTSKALTHLRFLASKATTAPWVFGGQLCQDLEFMGFLHRDWTEWFDAGRNDLVLLADFLSQARAQAWEKMDFSEVDSLKAKIIAAGLEVRMSKAGIEIARKQLESINTAYARANRAVATEDDDEADFWYGIAEQMQTGIVPCKENQEQKIQALVKEWNL